MDINLSSPILNQVSKNDLSLVKQKITDIIDETFVVTADDDYLNARWLSISGMHRSFFWAASQAIEKYLKANLLYHGISVKDYGHKIIAMTKELQKHDSEFRKLQLTPPQQLEFLRENKFWGTTEVGSFIDEVCKYGSPDNRYDYFGVDYKPSYLFKLDKLVFSLRGKVARREFLEKFNRIEKVFYFAYEQNFFFAPDDYVHQSVYEIITGRLSVPSIELALKDCYGNSRIYKTWLTENIKIDINMRAFKRN